MQEGFKSYGLKICFVFLDSSVGTLIPIQRVVSSQTPPIALVPMLKS